MPKCEHGTYKHYCRLCKELQIGGSSICDYNR